MNKQVRLAISVLCFGAWSVGLAADFEDYARVVSVNPQVEQVNQTLWTPMPACPH